MTKALNITDVLGTGRNRVLRIGVELEGAWKTVPPGMPIVIDTSVFRNQLPPEPNLKIGELPLGPMPPLAAHSVMKRFYPLYIDKTCGLHVHMSFENLWYYNLLMTPEYPKTMLKYLEQWAKEEEFPLKHHIWSRVKGTHKYCLDAFWPDTQAQKKRKEYNHEEGHRYTAIHYCGRLNTIECRVLPMLDTPEQAARGVRRVIDITNACIIKLGKKREKPSKKNVTLPNRIEYSERVVSLTY